MHQSRSNSGVLALGENADGSQAHGDLAVDPALGGDYVSDDLPADLGDQGQGGNPGAAAAQGSHQFHLGRLGRAVGEGQAVDVIDRRKV